MKNLRFSELIIVLLYLFQVAQALDDSMSPEIQNHLFQEPGKRYVLTQLVDFFVYII